MRASEVYEGYAIDAATHQAGPMRWGWTYLIDGKHSGEGAGRPMRTEALALMDAVGEAKARIRHWLRSGGPPPKAMWPPLRRAAHPATDDEPAPLDQDTRSCASGT